MEELKRCPFCGSIPTLYHDGLHQVDSKRRYHTTWMILCEKCNNASMSNSAYYSFDKVEDRKALVVILSMNGYTVRVGKEKRSGKSTLTYFVEYWRGDDE